MRIPILQNLMDGPEKRALDRSARLLEQGKTDAAVDALRAGLAKVPGNPELQLELGRVLGLAGRGGESSSALRSLLRTTPDAADRVRELAEMGRYENREVGHLHDVLAEHFVRRGDLGEAQAQLEKIDRASLGRYAAAQRKRFDAGMAGGEGKVARASLLSGSYVALAHEAMGEDAAALQTYGVLLRAAPDLYQRVRDRLRALASRNYRDVPCRMQVLDLYLASGDTATAADEAGLLLEAVPQAAGQLAGRLEEHLAQDPDRSEVRLVLAKARWAEGRHDEAVDLLDPLSADGDHDDELARLLGAWRVERPDAARVSLMLAEILGRGGKGSQAIQAVAEVGKDLPPEQVEPALERLIDANPAEPRAYRLLAELRQGQGDADGAVEAVASLRRNAPAHLGEAAGVLRAVLGRDSGHRAAHRLLAEVLLERGEIDAGVTLMRHLMWLEPSGAAAVCEAMEAMATANPGHPGARLGAAEAWLRAGHAGRALPHLEAAAATPELAAQVAHRLSALLRRDPQHSDAVAAVSAHLQGKLADPAALPFLRAECAFAAGDPERAADLLGEAYGHGAGRAAGAALSLLGRIVEAHPDSSSPRMLMANILADGGDALRAVSVVADAPAPDPGMVSLLLERLEGMLAGRPRDVATRTGLARLLLFAGRPQEAATAAEEALAEAGGEAPGALHLVHGEARLALGDRAAAVEGLCRAAERDPEMVDRARAALETAREAAPGDVGLTRALARLRVRAGDVDGGLALLAELSATDGPAALEEAGSLAAARPDDPRPRFALARMQAAAGAAAAAAASLEAATRAGAAGGEVEEIAATLLAKRPDQPDLLFLLARLRAGREPAGACALLQRAAAASEAAAARAVAALEELGAANPALPEPGLAVARIRMAGADAAGAFTALEPWLAGSQPPPEALDLLREVRRGLPHAPDPALALARVHLRAGEDGAARRELIAARDAGASPATLAPLLDDLLRRGEDDEARLLRAGIRIELGELDGAVDDLEAAAGRGRADDACAAAALLLERRPEHLGARRLHVQMLRRGGRAAEARASLDAALETEVQGPERSDLLLERSGLRRAAGDAQGAADDLREAQELAADRDAFLDLLHARHARRQRHALSDAPPAERVRTLLDMGRLEDAARALQEGGLDDEEHRTLRAALLLARGEAAAGLRLMRTAPPAPLLVDAAQRCDRPEVALAALDRMLEAGEQPHLERARRRLAGDIWKRGLDPGRRALVARTAFVPRGEE